MKPKGRIQIFEFEAPSIPNLRTHFGCFSKMGFIGCYIYIYINDCSLVVIRGIYQNRQTGPLPILRLLDVARVVDVDHASARWVAFLRSGFTCSHSVSTFPAFCLQRCCRFLRTVSLRLSLNYSLVCELLLRPFRLDI